MSDIKREETEALQIDLASNKRRKELLQLQIDTVDESIRLIQQELDRRSLDAYWKSHSEQTRIDIGDKLLITEEYNQWYKHYVRQMSFADVGAVCNVTEVSMRQGELQIAVDGNITASIPNEKLIYQMRRAYLRQEATHENPTE